MVLLKSDWKQNVKKSVSSGCQNLVGWIDYVHITEGEKGVELATSTFGALYI